MRKVIAMSMLSLMTASAALADQDGTSTAAFLRISQGARAAGMGGAFTAVADDAYAASWNPAGLAQISRQQLAVNHLQFIEKINSEFVSYVLPINKIGGTLNFSGTYVNFGSIERRDITGAIESGDNDVNAYAATLSYGQAVGERMAIGLTGRILNQNLAGTKSSGASGDAGVMIDLVPNRLVLGASIQNLGPKLSVGREEEDLPTTLRGGLAYNLIPRIFTLAADIEKERSTDAILHGGAEYIYQTRFALRAGYQDTKDAKGGLSAGAGFIWRPRQEGGGDFFAKQDGGAALQDTLEIRFDYAFVDMGDFDTTHRVGVHVSF